MRKDIGIWLHMNTFDAYGLASNRAITIPTSDSMSFQDSYTPIHEIEGMAYENQYRITLLTNDVERLRQTIEILCSDLNTIKHQLNELGIPSIDDLL